MIQQITVKFLEGLPIEQVVAKVSQLSNPQVIIWYIGSRGLRKAGIEFYKNFIISPLLASNKGLTFWLVDLTAWGAFKDSRCSIQSFSCCCNVIENAHSQIKCIKSSEIFKKMQQISDNNMLNYFKKALSRNFICQASKHFPNENIRTGDIFSNNCPVAFDIYDFDASKSYSILQYLEGCLLVDELFVKQLKNNANEIQLVFALPNDELKYYKDNERSFQKDITFIISKHSNLNINNINLEIIFLGFKYGLELQDRPYNAPGRILKNRSLSSEDITGQLNDEKK